VLLAWTLLASPLISGNTLTDVLHVTTGACRDRILEPAVW